MAFQASSQLGSFQMTTKKVKRVHMKEILTLMGNYQKWKFIEVLLPFHVKSYLYNDVNIPPVKYPSINGRLCCWATFWRLFQIIQGSCLAPDWLSIHLEVVQKHSCAGSICNFLFVASQTHYCASYPNHNHMGPSAVVEFSHWWKHTNSGGAATFSVTMSFPFAVMASMNQALSQHLSQIMGTDNGQLLSKPSLEWGLFWNFVVVFFLLLLFQKRNICLDSVLVHSYLIRLKVLLVTKKKKRDKYGIISV